MERCKILFVLSREAVNSCIPYRVVCEAKEGSRWNTMHRRRRWKEEFTETERKAAGRLFSLAHRWTLTMGVPDTVKMNSNTLNLWMKLGAFCASI